MDQSIVSTLPLVSYSASDSFNQHPKSKKNKSGLVSWFSSTNTYISYEKELDPNKSNPSQALIGKLSPYLGNSTVSQTRRVSSKIESPRRKDTPDLLVKTVNGENKVSISPIESPIRQFHEYSCIDDIDHYEIISVLGKGTFGKVYLTQHKETKDYAAIKKIDMRNIKTTKEKKNLAREIRLLKILHHPNIIKIHEIKEGKDSTLIIMEYCARGELHDYITSKGRLAEAETREFFRQILSAIQYCHESSIVHRDLKPENLLLDAEAKTVKLIDFGFGNTWTRGAFLNTFCGSPFYAAPEMTQGIEYTGPEVDIWSMGVILYMMLTGNLPFQGANISQLYESIGSGLYMIPEFLSSEACDLLSRMLQVNPKKRASLDEIKNHPWTNIGKAGSVLNHLPSRSPYLRILDEETLNELVPLGYQRSDYENAFSDASVEKSPVKSLYHLHYEWIQRKKAIVKAELKRRVQLSSNSGTFCDMGTLNVDEKRGQFLITEMTRHIQLTESGRDDQLKESGYGSENSDMLHQRSFWSKIKPEWFRRKKVPNKVLDFSKEEEEEKQVERKPRSRTKS